MTVNIEPLGDRLIVKAIPGGTEIKVDGESLLVLRESDVLARIKTVS